MSIFYNDTVTRRRPSTMENRAGEIVPDLRRLTEGVAWPDVHVRPMSQTESSDVDRAAKVSRWRIASKPGTGDFDVTASDVIVLPTGEVTQVVGDPARPSDPVGGGLHHIELLVERVSG